MFHTHRTYPHAMVNRTAALIGRSSGNDRFEPATSFFRSGMTTDTSHGMKYLTEDSVRTFLRAYPEALEKYVMEEVDLDLLERWIIRRTQRAKKPDKINSCRKTSLSRWKVIAMLITPEPLGDGIKIDACAFGIHRMKCRTAHPTFRQPNSRFEVEAFLVMFV